MLTDKWRNMERIDDRFINSEKNCDHRQTEFMHL